MSGGVSLEQITRAKAISIVDYILSHEPNNVKRVGQAFYLKDHTSLEISNGLWNWHSHGIGGKNVVDFLIKVRGYGFVDAVRHLVGDEIVPTQNIVPKARLPTENKQTKHVPFNLPPRNRDNERVIAYLESRGISKPLIIEATLRGSLYETATYHNACFVGRDENGKARFALLRGTMGNFKRDADGSEKKYGFCLPPNARDCKTVIVFESPIDAFSHQTLYPEVDGYRLSLGGTALGALTHFLDIHKEVVNVTVCTDNDVAGKQAAAKIAELPNIAVSRSKPEQGKDWNEFLQITQREVNEMQDARKDIRFINSDYKTLFTIKDGENIKFTSGYDGAESVKKCRWIDETHTVIGNETYHICQWAEICERNGHKFAAAEKPENTIDILSAKYGEDLKTTAILMTEAAIKKLVGGKGPHFAATISKWSCFRSISQR